MSIGFIKTKVYVRSNFITRQKRTIQEIVPFGQVSVIHEPFVAPISLLKLSPGSINSLKTTCKSNLLNFLISVLESVLM